MLKEIEGWRSFWPASLSARQACSDREDEADGPNQAETWLSSVERSLGDGSETGLDRTKREALPVQGRL